MDGSTLRTSGRAVTLVRAAGQLRARVDALRNRFDEDRRLPDSLVRTMRDEGLFGLWLPARYGGAELGVAEFVDVVTELARLDGSVGWCAAIAGSYGRLAGYLDPRVADHIFTSGCVVAGQLNPSGRAVIEDGGYRVSGQWAFGSGIEHSDWTIGICTVHDGASPMRDERGAPVERLFFIPTRDVEIIDTWRVGGLRATGSHDYRISDAFVEKAFTICAVAPSPVAKGMVYAFPFRALFGVAIAATMLGIARATIDALQDLALVKASPRTSGRLREVPQIQTDLGRAEARFRSARALLLDAAAEVAGAVERGEALSVRHRALLRLANTDAAVSAAQVVSSMYTAGGGSSVYEGSRLERCHRDIHAAAQHRAVSIDNYAMTGRVFLGLEPGMRHF